MEAGVPDEYIKACIEFGSQDIVMTERISGTPCTVINTTYVQKIGNKESLLESVMNKNKKLKKWVKMIHFLIFMKITEKAAKQVTYETVWVAGPVLSILKKSFRLTIIQNLTG